MKVYSTLPDDPEFVKQTNFDLCVLFVVGMLLAFVLVGGSCYGLYDYIDKKNTEKVMKAIDGIGK